MKTLREIVALLRSINRKLDVLVSQSEPQTIRTFVGSKESEHIIRANQHRAATAKALGRRDAGRIR